MALHNGGERMSYTGSARAHTNIALIKYWGKRDKELFLPMNSSLSLTLDAFYTDTTIEFSETNENDIFYLNTIRQSKPETEKLSCFLNLFRSNFDIDLKATIKSINHVPTGAGLASSASAFAALAAATRDAFNLDIDDQTLSTYARRGSGSATRSIYGGFVEWQKGTSSETSCAIPIDNAEWDIGMVIVVVNSSHKKISSRVGMERTVQTSPFYPAWLETAAADLENIKEAIYRKDFVRLGEITESNAMKMHATTLGSLPPFTYWEEGTMTAMNCVYKLREAGIPCYFTIDAGPNVKILCRKSDISTICSQLSGTFDDNQLVVSSVGDGVKHLTIT